MADQYLVSGDEANVLGAVLSQMRGRGGGLVRSPVRMPAPRPMLPAEPVQNNPSELRSYMGFGFVVWTAADATDKIITIEPQESFRGERLIIDVTAAGGAAAGLTLLRRIDIGTQPQSPSVEQAAPAAMFRADAVDSQLDLQVAFRGTKIQLTMGQTAAPGAGVTVTAAIGMFGRWVR